MNFCSTLMESKVKCSCISSDGFEAENLMELSSKTKGFQAERFARAPVFITVQFVIPVQVQYIVITPFIGQQCAKVVNIYVLNSSRNSEPERPIDSDEVTFRAGTVELCQSASICFKNKHFQSSCDINDSPRINDQQLVVEMQGKLHHVVALKVAVMSMRTGSVPSVRCLEVWGVPANFCNKTKVKELKEKWKEFKRAQCNQNRHSLVTTSISTVKLNEHDAKNFKNTSLSSIPKEFIDPLMFSLMRNPVLLPSGQTVDRSTLDKHILSQAEWGRPPSDPFTGIAFTETYQPVPNVTLKLKLDQYEINNLSSNGEYSQSGCSKNGVYAVADEQLRKNENILSRKLNEQASESSNEVIPNHTNRRTLRIQHTSNNPLRCCKCRTLFSLLTSQYSLPCCHRLCRSCLVDVTSSLTCPQCAKPFDRKHVTRTHS